ncbi:MAG: Sporulation protein YtxC [Firmicutes bacterium]|nr:Sporulation protein YtxC [Bacillota bacterium]
MKILSLGLTGALEDFRAKLQNDCGALVQEGFRIAIDETNKGHYTFLGCNIAEGELSFRNYERVKNMLKGYVSQRLTDVIINEEKSLLRKIVNNNYRQFNEEECNIILDNAMKLLQDNGSLLEQFNYRERYTYILNQLQEYLTNHHELVLDGFLAFRLKEYRGKLANVVDKAVDAYMLEAEYKEFIQVLRYFVEIQEVQVEEVHVIVDNQGQFTIRDSNGKVINHQYVEAFMVKKGEEISFEDMLISALITLAPRYVMIHFLGDAGERIAATIKSVFEGRVLFCHGCDICEDYISDHYDGRN